MNISKERGWCLNENNELIHIGSVSKDNRYEHSYFCLECGQPMIAKIGTERIHHFAHKVDTECDGESYLHKLAKRRIRDKFMSSNSFPITFIRDVSCQNAQSCSFYTYYSCFQSDVRILKDLKTWNGKVVYDNCEEEVQIEQYRPDLLLTRSLKPDNVAKLFIEIYKTHKSEGSKITSKYRIIETNKITNEADIDDIINRGFIENENCKLYNFKNENLKLPFIKLKQPISIIRFFLFKSGACKINYSIMCDKLEQKVHPQSIKELNLKENDLLDPYRTGLVYFVKKGLNIKNCFLCKFYKFSDWYSKPICILYKSLGEKYRFPNQKTAFYCSSYKQDPVLMKYSIITLENYVSEIY